MEIAGLIIGILGLLGTVAGGIRYVSRRRAYGVGPVLDGLLRLQAASDNGRSVSIRDHGIFSDDGRAAIQHIKDSLPAVVDKKLIRTVERVTNLYEAAERDALPHSAVDAFEIAARHFEADRPARLLVVEVENAVARARQVDRR